MDGSRAGANRVPDQALRIAAGLSIDGHPPIRMLPCSPCFRRARREWEACGVADQVAPTGSARTDSPRYGAVSLVNGDSVIVSGELDARCTGRHRTYTSRISDQSELPALVDGLRPVDDTELAHDVAQVRLDRLLADEELLTDVAVG